MRERSCTEAGVTPNSCITKKSHSIMVNDIMEATPWIPLLSDNFPLCVCSIISETTCTCGEEDTHRWHLALPSSTLSGMRITPLPLPPTWLSLYCSNCHGHWGNAQDAIRLCLEEIPPNSTQHLLI